MSKSSFDRREFLRITTATSVGLAIFGASSTVGCDRPSIRLTNRQMNAVPAAESYFADRSLTDAKRIGRAYLSQHVRSRASLDAWLAPTVRVIGGRVESEAIARLEDALSDDFDALRIVDVGGWTLGRTEVALCVLVALGSSV